MKKKRILACLCPEQPGTFCGLIRAVGGEVGLGHKDKEKQ
jgi:hypothetical protein